MTGLSHTLSALSEYSLICVSDLGTGIQQAEHSSLTHYFFSNRIKWRATTLLTFSIFDARTVSLVYVNYNKTEQNVHIHWHIANA